MGTKSNNILRLSGRLDAEASFDLRDRLSELFEGEDYRVTVDLHDVEFVDSSGLAALVWGMKRCRQNDGELQLCKPSSDDAFRVFELTRFDAVFKFVRSDLLPVTSERSLQEESLVEQC